jgi:hypothetical protein
MGSKRYVGGHEWVCGDGNPAWRLKHAWGVKNGWVWGVMGSQWVGMHRHVLNVQWGGGSEMVCGGYCG